MKVVRQLLILSLLICAVTPRKKLLHIPDYLKKFMCSKLERKYDACVVQNFNKFVPHLANGIPEMGIPPLDPFEMLYFSDNRTIHNIIQVKTEIKDMVAHGIRGLYLEHFKSDHTKSNLDYMFRLPKLDASLDYYAKGTFNKIPFLYEGRLEVTIFDVKIDCKLRLSVYNKNGTQLFKVEDLKPRLTIRGGNIDIIVEDPKLQMQYQSFLAYFNNNPPAAIAIIQGVLPSYFNYANMIRDGLNIFLGQLPAEEILPGI